MGKKSQDEANTWCRKGLIARQPELCSYQLIIKKQSYIVTQNSYLWFPYLPKTVFCIISSKNIYWMTIFASVKNEDMEFTQNIESKCVHTAYCRRHNVHYKYLSTMLQRNVRGRPSFPLENISSGSAFQLSRKKRPWFDFR